MRAATMIPLLMQAILLLCSCAAKHPQQPGKSYAGNTDTSYTATTRDLKSNHIPDSVFQLQHLKSIFIQGMDCDYGDHTHCWEITEIPAAIKNLTALTTLRLTVNAIQVLPAEMAALQQLKVLDLSDNAGLQSYEVITQLTDLEVLNLYGCGLTTLPQNIANLSHLKELGIRGNQFDEKEIARIRKALPQCRIIY